jgi:hypothetical protein
MKTEDLIRQISEKDVDIQEFVLLVTSDTQIRDEIVRLMLTHPHIMVYYHCYYVVDRASQERPDLFYPYWQDVAALLHHKNSYHRDFALTVIANLTQVDSQGLFTPLFEDYFACLHDAKFMTGQCCVQNSRKILVHKPEFRHSIVTLLLDTHQQSAYTEKQQAVLSCDVLEVLDAVYAQINGFKGVNEFITEHITSISPKTRRKARELVRKYDL